jgi:hypothetical protein
MKVIEMLEAEWRDRLKAAVLAEREACAKVCSELADKALVCGDGDSLNCFEEVEERIRARGEA